jgi:hypothetical protein
VGAQLIPGARKSPKILRLRRAVLSRSVSCFQNYRVKRRKKESRDPYFPGATETDVEETVRRKIPIAV